jgi:Zn-dependent peptidase ImmA (M78 family)
MKKLNVLGSKVSVKIKKIVDEKNAAEYDHDTKTITVDPSESDLFHSLCHELGHAYWHRSGLFQANRKDETEEIFCETFANLISDNIVVLYQMHNKLKRK